MKSRYRLKERRYLLPIQPSNDSLFRLLQTSEAKTDKLVKLRQDTGTAALQQKNNPLPPPSSKHWQMPSLSSNQGSAHYITTRFSPSTWLKEKDCQFHAVLRAASHRHLLLLLGKSAVPAKVDAVHTYVLVDLLLGISAQVGQEIVRADVHSSLISDDLPPIKCVTAIQWVNK